MNVTQAQFQAGLLDPEVAAPSGLTNPDGAQASQRYDVYRNNVAVSLADALEAAFPVVRKLVGDEFFRAMAGVYLRKHPPRDPLMMFYGDRMPQFLMRFEPARGLKYLPDIARLELAMRRAYHAADANPMTSDQLSALSPDSLMAARFTLAPAVEVMSSDHPIHSIYLANTRSDAAKPKAGPQAVLITRARFDPTPHLIPQATATFVSSLSAGDPLGVAMTKSGAELDLGAALGVLMSQNAISNLKGPAT